MVIVGCFACWLGGARDEACAAGGRVLALMTFAWLATLIEVAWPGAHMPTMAELGSVDLLAIAGRWRPADRCSLLGLRPASQARIDPLEPRQ